MKKHPAYLLLTAVLAAGSVFAADKTNDKPSNVVVTFADPEHFTDAQSTFGMGTDKGYLDILEKHIQRIASRRLAAGQKLEVTIKDVDLAGEFLPTRGGGDQVRIVKEIFIPRMSLSFKLTAADGSVVKEGERKLQDLNFMNTLALASRSEELFYDRTLLTSWIEKEFKP